MIITMMHYDDDNDEYSTDKALKSYPYRGVASRHSNDDLGMISKIYPISMLYYNMIPCWTQSHLGDLNHLVATRYLFNMSIQKC